MAPSPEIIGVVFDFDDTLVPDSTTKLLQTYGFDTERFWKEEVRALVVQGYDPTLAWLQLILENVGEGKKLGLLTNEILREFGASLDDDFFEGLPDLFPRLQEEVRQYRDISLEFYIVSSGLREVILGSSVVREHFAGVYGSEFGEGEGGVLRYIKRCVTFTEKTRYLFEINKGLPFEKTLTNPLLVNTDVPKNKRRIPLENMIYVGDGLTDIPCFSLLKNAKGTVFGVFDPTRKEKAKQALLEFLRPQRVLSVHAPKFGPEHELGSLLEMAVAARCAQIELERDQAYGGG